MKRKISGLLFVCLLPESRRTLCLTFFLLLTV